MRLLRLELRNWCQFDQFACDFHPGMTAIIGQNGSGKSNILGAVSWLLTGENPNKGVKELNIRQAAPETAAANGTLTFEHMGQTCSVTRHLRPTRSRATFSVNGVQTALGDTSVTTAIAEALQLNTKVITRFVIVAQADIYGFLESTDSQVDQFFQRLFDTAAATECVKAIGSATAKIQVPQIPDNETTAAVGATIIHCEEQIRQLQATLQLHGGPPDPAADQQDYAIINAAGSRELLNQQYTQAQVTLSATANDLANKEAELLQLQRDRDTLQQAVNEKTPNADKARAALQSWATYQSLMAQRQQVEDAITKAEQDASARVAPTQPLNYIADAAAARTRLVGLQHQIGGLVGATSGYSAELLLQEESRRSDPPTLPTDYADAATQRLLGRERNQLELRINDDQQFVSRLSAGQDCPCPTCRTIPEPSRLTTALEAARQAITTNQQMSSQIEQRLRDSSAYDMAKIAYDHWLQEHEQKLAKLRQQQADFTILEHKRAEAVTLEAAVTAATKFDNEQAAYTAWRSQYDAYIQGLYTQRQQLTQMPSQAAVDQPSLQAIVADLDEYRKGLDGLTPTIDGLQGQINRLRTNHGVQAGRLQEIEGQLNRLPAEAAVLQAQQRVQSRQQASAARTQATIDLQVAQGQLTQARQQWPISQAKEREAASLGAWLLKLERMRSLLAAAPRFVAQHNLQLLKRDIDATLDIFDSRFHVTADEGLRFTAGFQDGRAQPADRLSGGQKVALALGFRVAVNSMFATRVGLLALDEPTAYLDKQRVRALAPVISRLRELTASRGLQCLIVTHEEELAPLFDATIRVGLPTVTG